MLDTRIEMGIIVLVYLLIFIAMILVAWVFVTVVNTFREVRYLRTVNKVQKQKLVDIGIERNMLSDQVAELQSRIHNQQPVTFWVRTCEMDDMRQEIKQLRLMNETLKKEIERRGKKAK